MSDNFTFYTTNLINKTTSAINLWFKDSVGAAWATMTSYDGTKTALYDRNRNTNLAMTSTGGGAGGDFVNNNFEMSLSSATNITIVGLQGLSLVNWITLNIRINSATTYSFNKTANIANAMVEFPTIAATTIEIYSSEVFAPASPKTYSISQIILAEKVLELPHNPNFADYQPIIKGSRNEKELSDGGYITYGITEKFQADIKLNYMPESITTELKDMWDSNTSYTFIPFPTATNSNWNGDAWEVNWIGNYEFKKNQRNERSTPYYTGTIRLKETPL